MVDHEQLLLLALIWFNDTKVRPRYFSLSKQSGSSERDLSVWEREVEELYDF